MVNPRHVAISFANARTGGSWRRWISLAVVTTVLVSFVGSPPALAAPPGLAVTNPGTQYSGVGVATSLPASASGGTTPYTWTATGLPTGLSINASTGLVSGTPTAAGSFSAKLTANDAGKLSGSASFTWTTGTAPTVTNPGTQVAVKGVPGKPDELCLLAADTRNDACDGGGPGDWIYLYASERSGGAPASPGTPTR
jgi:hypothetical protein